MRIRDYIRDGLAMGQKRVNKSGLRVGKIIRGQSGQSDIHGIVRKTYQASCHNVRDSATQTRPRYTAPLLTSSAAKRIAKILITPHDEHLAIRLLNAERASLRQ